jgi:hypothetical protein
LCANASCPSLSRELSKESKIAGADSSTDGIGLRESDNRGEALAATVRVGSAGGGDAIRLGECNCVRLGLRERLGIGLGERVCDGVCEWVWLGLREQVAGGVCEHVGLGLCERVGDGVCERVGLGLREPVGSGLADLVGLGERKGDGWQAYELRVSPPIRQPPTMQVSVFALVSSAPLHFSWRYTFLELSSSFTCNG